MRVVVLFDLPTGTKKERSAATRFRNFLLDDGFDMLQYSVYSRICVDRTNANTHLLRVKRNAPENGSVRLLMVTENQFANMEIIVGKKTAQEIAIPMKQLAFF
jgi:CRISPR-associated protein Cas2